MPASKRHRKARRSEFRLEEFEPRVLFSADLPTAVLGLVPVDQTLLTTVTEDQTRTAAQSDHDILTGEDATAYVTELVIVDSAVDNPEAILADLSVRPGINSQIVVLNEAAGNATDALTQLSDVLSNHHRLQSVHLISHGAQGELLLGGQRIDTVDLLSNSALIEQWQAVLAPGADMFLYGCEVAGSGDGNAFVETLALLSGADVAASTDPTGSEHQGGDWDLEYSIGQIDSDVAINERILQDWSGLLDITSNLVVHLELEESSGSTAQDSTANNNDGTWFNGPTFSIDSAVGNRSYDFSLDGAGSNAVVSVADDASLDFSSDFTVAFWYKASVDQANATRIIGSHDGSSGFSIFAEADESLNLFLQTSGGSSTTLIRPGGMIDDGNWHHVAVVRAGNAFSIYVDNNDGSGSNFFSGGGTIDPSAALTIGGQSPTIGDFEGKLDDVRVYTRGLSAADVTELYTYTGSGPQTYTVTNTNDSGAGSLRQAIINANTNAGADTIEFNISGSGTQVINLASDLETITEEVTIDGTTQTGWVEQSFIPVVIDGGSSYNLLNFTATADNSEVRGLVIRDASVSGVEIDDGADGITLAGNWIGQFNSDGTDAGVAETNSYGIRTYGDNTTIGGSTNADRNVLAGDSYSVIVRGTSNNTTVSGNYMGTDIAGNALLGDILYGVFVQETVTNLTVGGATAAHGNVIAGATNSAITMFDETIDNNTIQHNYIGVSADGTTNLGNYDAGIELTAGGDNNQILDNIIAGSGQVGIEISGAATGNLIHGNIIGTDASGNLNWGSGEYGILVHNGATNNTIGGVGIEEENVIAFSGQSTLPFDSGVSIQDTSTGNTIRGNSIYSNVGIGVDLSDSAYDGVNTNDAGDSDGGGNNRQNWAAINSVSIAEDGTFAFNLDTTTLAAGTYTIDFYASRDRDGGQVEGERYLGTLSGAAHGNSSLSGTLSGIDMLPGEFVTLVTTDSSGNSSELSPYAYASDGDSDGTSPEDIKAITTKQGGLNINDDGGDDTYLLADNSDALLGGLTSLSFEMQFASSLASAQSALVSYSVPDNHNEMLFEIFGDGNAKIQIAGLSVISSAFDYNALRDGNRHSLGFTWDSSSGNWAIYANGVEVDSTSISGGSLLSVGRTVESGGALLFGQEQDGVEGGFDTQQEFSGTLYNARLFGDVRTDVEMASSYRSELPFDEPDMLAQWNFNHLSVDGVIADSVGGNNLRVKHTSETGFTASEASLTLSLAENAGVGTLVGSVEGVDPQREARISALLAADPDLIYSAETGKFYKAVSSSANLATASTNAIATTLSGEAGQLVTIRSAAEQALVADMVSSLGTLTWVGASDATVEGEWRWQNGADDDDRFWSGDEDGYNPDGAYHNWLSGKPDSGSGNEDGFFIRSDGFWDDDQEGAARPYIIEWDADTVLDATQAISYTIQSQTVAGTFEIDSDSGEIRVLDGSLLDADTQATHTLSIRATDVDGNEYEKDLFISLNDLIEVSTTPTDLSSGIELNTDGGNDAYLEATDGGAILGGLSEFTFETQLLVEDIGDNFIVSFSTAGGNAFMMQLRSSDDLRIDLNGSSIFLSGIDYGVLKDGDVHTLSFSWDNTNGDYALYIDGELTDSGSGLETGNTINGSVGSGTLLFGQEQDSVGGGFSSDQIFSGTLYDVRIWDEVRSEAEISLNHQKKFDPGSLPSGLIANWQMDGFDGSGDVVDIISANNLSVAHASGTGYITSTPVADLHISENAHTGDSVGFVVPSDPDAPQDIVSDGGFHDTSPGSVVSSGNSFGSWTVTQGNVDVGGSVFERSPLGGQAVDMNGSNAAGAIAQTLSTEAGQQYQVVFAMSGNWAGGDTIKDVRVSAGGVSQDYSLAQPDGWALSNMLWSNRSFTFTADGASTDLAFESLDSASPYGPAITDVRVIEIPQAISTILLNDSTLDYDAATNKFYRYVSADITWPVAQAAAISSELNGVSGQLVTIRSAHENEILRNQVVSDGSLFWLGAADVNTEGDWYWYEGSNENELFWQGTSGGSAEQGSFENWQTSSGQPNDFGGVQDYAAMWLDGSWHDFDTTSTESYVIEWNASDVLSNFAFSMTDASSNFEIDSNTGAISVSATSSLDYENATSHSVDVTVTDAGGRSYVESMTVVVDNELEATHTIPAAQTIDEDSTLTFTSGTATEVSVSDTVAASDSLMRVELTVNDGVLNLDQITGLTFIEGSDGSTGFIIDGTETDINSALDGMTFTPDANFTGSVTLNMSTTLAADLAGRYTFDDTTANDSSAGTTQDGTFVGNATTTSDVTRGEVLGLDGDGDSIIINSNFDAPTSATLSAWVNLTSADTNGAEVISISDDLAIRLDSLEPIDAFYWDGSNWQFTGSTSNAVGAPIGNLAGTGWHHVSFVVDDINDLQLIYLDGKLVAKSSFVTTMNISGTTTTIGDHGNGGTGYDFDGLMDDVRIYTRALSSNEIAALAADRASVTDSLPITVSELNDAPTFNAGGGYLTTDASGSNETDIALAVLTQADGKLLVSGWTFNGSDNDFLISRYNADGSLDTSFGISGSVTLDFINDESFDRIAVQPNGKIIVAGSTNGSFNSDITVVRLNTDGSFDTSFGGGDGIVTYDSGSGDDVGDVQVLGNGKILVFGEAGSDLLLLQFNADGSLDTTFGGGDGIVTTDVAGSGDNVAKMHVLADGKFIVGSSYFNGFGALRYNSDGTLDTTYGGGDGIVTAPLGISSALAYGTAVTDDGSVIVGGRVNNGGSGNDYALVKFDATGAIDTSFGGGDGIAIFDNGEIEEINDLKLQSDGKIVAVGQSANGTLRASIVRFNTDGSLDSTFGIGGELIFAQGTSEEFYAVNITANDDIVVVGTSNDDVAIARYNKNGDPDAQFNAANTLDGNPTFIEDGAAVTLDVDVEVFDAELSAADDFEGATLTLQRNAGADSEDVFSATGNLVLNTGTLELSAANIGSYTNVGGQLNITFASGVTNTQVNEVMQSIAYANNSDSPPASVQIDWTFSDGNTGDQGSGGALTAIGSTTVNIQSTPDLAITVPAATAISEDSMLTFVSGTATEVSVSDGLAGDNRLQVALSVNDGVLLLSQTTGITFVDEAHGSDSFVFNGTESSINAALNGMTFQPNAEFFGAVTLTVTTSLDTDLEGYYTFEGNVNDVAKGTANNGTLVGGASIDNDATRGDVLSLDNNNQYVEIPGVFGNPANVTLAAWVNVNSGTFADEIISLGDNVGLRSVDGANGLSFIIRGTSSWQTVATRVNISDAGWTHVAATFDDATGDIAIYINGELAATDTAAESIQYNLGANTRVGENGNGLTHPMDGLIDEVRIYNRALSAEEVAALATDQVSAIDTVTITVNDENDAPTFGVGPGISNEIVSDGTGGQNEQANDVIALADGSSISVGYATVNSEPAWAVVKWTADGSLDTSFATDGVYINEFGARGDYARSVVEQSDGKLVIGGYADNTDRDYTVIRLNADGSVDEDFGTLGVATIDLGGTEFGSDIAIQSNGSILITGSTTSDTDIRVVRLRGTDGGLDNTFGTNGVATINLGGTEDAYSVAVDGSGRIMLGGVRDGEAFVARLTSTGTLDTSFNTTGYATTVLDGISAYTDQVLVQSDGGYVIVGPSYDYSLPVGQQEGIGIARYTSVGVLDSGFGDNGVIRQLFYGVNSYNFGSDVAQQSDGKLIVAGAGSATSQAESVVIRYNTDGTLDTSFGDNGIALAPSGFNWSEGVGVDIASDGTILVAGYGAYGGTSDFDTTIWRYDSTGSLIVGEGSGRINDSPTFIEDGAAVVLDTDVFVYDRELSANENFNGSSLTLVRNGGASVDDVFSATGVLGTLTESGNLVYDGTTIGTVTTNSGGTLVLSFNASTTNDLVNKSLRSIAYSNSSDGPPASVQIDWTFSDGGDSVQTQGGSAQQVLGSATVNIVDAPDPAYVVVPIAQSVNEDTPLTFSVGGGNTITIDSGSSDDRIVTATLSVSNGTLTLDTTNGIRFLDGTSDGDATITIAGTESAINMALDGLEFLGDADYNGSDTLTITTGSSAVTEANLYARYEFLNGSLEDETTNNFNGTPTGDPSLTADAERGDVLTFDGDDRVNIINGTVGLGEEVTVSAWVKLDAGQTDTVFLSIGDEFFIRLDPTTMGFGPGVSASGFTTYSLQPGNDRIGGTGWNHLAASMDDTNNLLSLYLNGELIKSSTYDFGDIDWAAAASQNITIGSMSDGSDALVGSLDDVRVYDSVLTQAEIIATMGDNGYDLETVAITIDAVNDAATFTTLPAKAEAIIASGVAAASVVTSTDLDNDGDTDLIGATANGQITWYANDGNGGFSAGTSLFNTAGYDFTSIATGDLDSDGDLDFLVTNNTPDASEDGILIFENQFVDSGNATFTMTSMETLSFGAFEVAIADIDDDTRLDIVASFTNTDEVVLYEQNTSGAFTRSVAATVTGARGIDIGNIDGDADLDIAVAGDSGVYWLDNDAATSPAFTVQTALILNDIADVVIEGINGDTDADIGYLRDFFLGTQVGWLESDGGATPAFTQNAISFLGNFSTFGNLATGDFNAQGGVDLAVTDISGDAIRIFNNDGSGSFTEDDQTLTPDGVEWVEAADIDGDGDLDFVTAQSGDLTFGAIYNRGSGLYLTVYANEDTALTGLQLQIDDVDANGADLEATLNVTNGSVTIPTGDVTFLTGNSGNTVTFTGTLLEINTALNSFSFTPMADYFGDAEITVTVDDRGNTGSGGAQLSVTPILIHVVSVNDAAEVSVNGIDVNFTEKNPVGIDVGATITDVDDMVLNGATVRISANYEVGVDQLQFTNQNGISGTYNNSTGVLTLSGSASIANYQIAIRSIVFDNQSDNPSTATRTIEWVVNDGDSTSTPVTRDIVINAVNDAPVVTGPGLALSFTEQGSLNIHGTGFSLTDVDDNGGTFAATFAVGEGRILIDAGDSGVTVISGDRFTSGNSTDTVTFSGTKTQLNALLSGSSTGTIVYRHDQTVNSDIPSASTTITLLINDQGNTGSDPGGTGDGSSEEGSASQSITISADNDAPLLLGTELVTNGDFATNLSGWSTTGQVSQSSGQARFGSGNIVGPHTLSQTLATISGASYTLEFDYKDDGLWNQQLQVTAGGVANLLTTEQILTDVDDTTFVRYRYSFAADSASTTLTFTDTSDDVGSQSAQSGGVDGYLDNISVRQKEGTLNTVVFTEGGSPVVLNSALEILDPELSDADNFAGATLTLTRSGGSNNVDLFSAETAGTLAALTEGGNLSVSGTTIGSVTTNSGGTLLLTFNGNATNARVNEAVQQIAYSNNNENSVASVDVRWAIDDGNSGAQGSGAGTAAGTTTVSISAVNDAPTIVGLAGDTLSYSEGDGAVVIEQSANAIVSDVDSADFDTGTLTVSFEAGSDNAEDVLAIVDQGTGSGQIGVSGSDVSYEGTVIGTFAGGSGGTDLVISFDADATPTAVSALIQAISYENTDTNNPTTGDRAVRYVLSDGDGGTGANYDTTIEVARVNDAPVVSGPGLALSFTEQGSLNLHATGFSLTDADDNGGTFTAIFAVGEGRILIDSGDSGVSVASGNSTDTVTLSGTKAQLNALLAGGTTGTIAYLHDQTTTSDTPSVSTTITLTVNDQGNSGADPGTSGDIGSEEGSASQTINILDVNDAPGLLGPELVSNGDLATGDLTDWTNAGTVAYRSGTIQFGGGNSSFGPHSVAQSITTVAGQEYVISFDYTDRNPLNTNLNQQLVLSVDGVSNLLTTEAIVSDTQDTLTFVRYSFTFVADSSLSTITFTDTSDEAGSMSNNTVNVDGRLDNVSVKQLGGELGATSFIEGGPAVVLDSNITVFDAEIDAAIDDFNGTRLTLTRNGGAHSDDVFSESGLLGTLSEGGNLVYNSVTIGAVTSNSGGTLLLTFNSTADRTLVDNVMQSIAYTNMNEAPASSEQIDWTFNDGNDASAQGSGGALQAIGYTTVQITRVNDTPMVSAPVAAYTVNEQTSLTIHGTGFSVSDVDAASGTMTAYLAVGEGTITVVEGDSGVTISSGNASGTVVLTGTLAQIDNLLTGSGTGTITYINNSDTPSASTTVTVTVNDGGNTGTDPGLAADGFSEEDSASQTINVTAVNDNPTNAGSLPTDIAVIEDITSDVDLSAVIFSDVDATNNSLTITLTTSNGGELITANSNGITLGGSNTATTITGTLTNLNDYFNIASNIAYLHSTAHTNGDNVDTIQVVINDNGHDGSEGGIDQVVGTVNVDITAVNDEEVLMNNTGTTVNEGSTGTVITTLMLRTTDVDNADGQLVYTLNAVPAHGTLRLGGIAMSDTDTFTQADVDAGNVTYDHDSSQTSNESFAFTVDDGLGSKISGVFNIAVANVNDTPVNTVPAAQTVNEDTSLAITGISVADDDDNLSTVQLSVNSGELSVALSGTASVSAGANNSSDLTLSGSMIDINNALATLNYLAELNFNGSDILTVLSTDTDSEIGSDTVAITVNPINDAPTSINLSAAENYTEDTILDLTDIIVGDVDGDDVTVVLTLSDVRAGSLSTGTSGDVTSTFVGAVWSASGAIADINTLLARVSFTPALNYNQNFSLSTSIDDGVAPTIRGTKAFSGTSTNDAPVFTSAAAANVEENHTGILTVTSTDIDGGIPNYSISDGGDASLFSLDRVSGSLSFEVAPDFEAPLDSDTDNVYNVTVKAVDGNGGTNYQEITVTVTNVNEAPTVADAEFEFYSDFQGRIGQLEATDPDSGDQLVFNLLGGNSLREAQAIKLSDDGVLSVNNLNSGTYEFEIVVVDSGGLAASAVLTLRVASVDLAAATPESTTTPSAQDGGDTIESTEADLPSSLPDIPSSSEKEQVPTEGQEEREDNDASSQEEDTQISGIDAAFPENWTVIPVLFFEPNQEDFEQESQTITASGISTRVTMELLIETLTDEQNALSRSFEFLLGNSRIPLSFTMDLINQLDAFRSEAADRETEAAIQATINTTVGVVMTVSLSVGLATWLVQSGLLAASALSTAPLWRSMDPTPILVAKGGVERGEGLQRTTDRSG